MGDINQLGTIPLGKVKTWDDSKAAGITPVSFPGQDSGKTEGVDTLGIIAYINISGRLTGSFNSLQNTIYLIKSIADGQQTSSQTLYSPFINSDTYSGAVKTRRQGGMGTNTSVTSNKLVDSAAQFSTRGVRVGDIVKNLTTQNIATVTAVDSDTQLSISSDIFTATGIAYAYTVNFQVKVLSIDTRWDLPGLNGVDYDLSVMQVRS